MADTASRIAARSRYEAALLYMGELAHPPTECDLALVCEELCADPPDARARFHLAGYMCCNCAELSCPVSANSGIGDSPLSAYALHSDFSCPLALVTRLGAVSDSFFPNLLAHVADARPDEVDASRIVALLFGSLSPRDASRRLGACIRAICSAMGDSPDDRNPVHECLLSRATLVTCGRESIISHLIVFCEHACVRVLAQRTACIPVARELRLLSVALDALDPLLERRAFSSDANALLLMAWLSQLQTLCVLSDAMRPRVYSVFEVLRASASSAGNLACTTSPVGGSTCIPDIIQHHHSIPLLRDWLGVLVARPLQSTAAVPRSVPHQVSAESARQKLALLLLSRAHPQLTADRYEPSSCVSVCRSTLLLTLPPARPCSSSSSSPIIRQYTLATASSCEILHDILPAYAPTVSLSHDRSSIIVSLSLFSTLHLNWAIASISAHIRRRMPGFEQLFTTVLNSLASVFSALELRAESSLLERARDVLQTLVFPAAGDANWLSLLRAEIALLRQLGLAVDAVCLVRRVFECAHCCKQALDESAVRQFGAETLADWWSFGVACLGAMAAADVSALQQRSFSGGMAHHTGLSALGTRHSTFTY